MGLDAVYAYPRAQARGLPGSQRLLSR